MEILFEEKNPFSRKVKSRIRLFKVWLYNILENENSPYNQIYNIFALFIVLTSSIGVVLEYTPIETELPPDLEEFLIEYEDVALWFFVVEYITRWWVISNFTDDFKNALIVYEAKRKKNTYTPFLRH